MKAAILFLAFLLAAPVAVGQIMFVGACAEVDDNDVGPITPTLPSTTAGHVAILHTGGRTTGCAFAVAPGGEWNLEHQQAHASGGSTAIFSRVLTGGDTNPTVSAPGTCNALTAIVMTFSGVNGTTPFDVAEAFTNGASTTATAPAITTVTANTMVVRIFTNNAVTTPANFSAASEGATAYDGTNYDQRMAHGASYVALASAGTTGTATMTLANSNQWQAITLALRPASTGGLLLRRRREQ